MSKVQSEQIRNKILEITKEVYPRMVREVVLTKIMGDQFSSGSIRSVYNGANGRQHKYAIPYVQPVRVGSALYYVYSPDNQTEPRREEYVSETLLINSTDEMALHYDHNLLKTVRTELIELLTDGPLEEKDVLYHLDQSELNYLNGEYDHHELKILLDVTIAYYHDDFDLFIEGVETLYSLNDNKKKVEESESNISEMGSNEDEYREASANLTVEYIDAIRKLERHLMEMESLQHTDYWVDLSRKVTELATLLYKYR